ncbi:MAG: beta-ketoacyl-ACP synthase II [Pseudomonadota bacterium]
MSKRRVVVTGLGIVSPVGSQINEAWDNVLNGRSFIGPITRFDVSAYPTRFAGDVRGFHVEDYLQPKEARRMDHFIQYGFAASSQAFKDSGLTVTEANAERIGVAMGAGIGGLDTIQQTHHKLLEAPGPRKVSPFFIPATIINMISGHVSICYGLKGPNLAMVTACTTSTHSIGIAARLIQYGDADVMIAGGAEMALNPLGVAGFCQAKALSERNDDPTKASRPFDRDRDGFVMGDGAGAIVLEEYEHAKARGARIYAEFVGFGMSGDAHHITAPPEDGDGARRSMLAAMNDAGIHPSQLQHINAHATSTPLGDVGETMALKRALGDAAYKVAISATKSITGHLLGAAGAVEAIFAILAIRDQVAPPTINLDNPDPRCDLDYVPHVARPMLIDVALSNSFGFGGTNGSLVFRRLQ